jgi:ATP-binding protein involved in chromosome partitioning
MTVTTGQPELTKEQIIEAIRPVNDPEIGRSLVELKMIPDIEITGRDVLVHVELTTPACPLKGKIEDDVRAALASTIPSVGDVTFKFTSRVRSSGAGRSDAQPIKGVKNAIAVASGKGGVGKSTVAVNLALGFKANGLRVGVLDADIYGPSVPRMLGISGKPSMVDKTTLRPMENYGLKCMSIGFLVPEDTPMIWRGPMVMSALQQMLRDVAWGELDVMIVDMPPGTGDAQLTMAQQVALAGAVIVSTPQDIALIDARKGLAMFEKVNVPVLGIIENMSYFLCPHCGERSDIFSHGGARREAQRLGTDFLGEIPLDLAIRETSDEGRPITMSQPDSPYAATFRDIAARVWEKVSGETPARRAAPRIVVE